MPVPSFPDPFGPKSRTATEITPKIRKGLEPDMWRVYTEDSITQNAIAEHQASQAESYSGTETIHYSGKEYVTFIVPFSVVMFLKKNRARGPYTFVAYHRSTRVTPWKLWKEGNKAPGEVLRNSFLNKKHLPRKKK
jgi:hypothetical protein